MLSAGKLRMAGGWVLAAVVGLGGPWAAPAFGGSQGWAAGQVELVGPLGGARVVGAAGSSTTFELELAAGERRLWRVPLPPREPRTWSVEGAGRAAVLGAETLGDRSPAGSSAGVGAGAGVDLPAGRPPAGGSGGGAGLGWGAWAALVGGLVAVLGLRRRPAATLAAGLASGAAAAWLVVGAATPVPGEVRVLDGWEGARVWGLLRGDSGALELFPGEWKAEGARVWARPQQPLEWWVGLAAGAESPRVELRMPGTQLWGGATLAPGLRVLSRELNGWGPALEAWSREPGAAWRYHGAWPLHAALPPEQPAEGARLPPSWLPEGLAPGAGALILRLAPGAHAGPGEWREAWLRLRLES